MPGTALFSLQRKTLIVLLGAGVFLSLVVSHAATASGKKLPPRPASAKKPAAKSPTRKKTTVKSGSARTSRKSSYKPRRTRPQPFRYRLARLKLQPERISEIQGALAQAGYLNQEPNGKWDDPTRVAMQRFQQDHGFPGTGLPEAKSLMKLGLGPHPLPEELDSTAQAAPSASPLGVAGAADARTETSPATNPQQ